MGWGEKVGRVKGDSFISLLGDWEGLGGQIVEVLQEKSMSFKRKLVSLT